MSVEISDFSYIYQHLRWTSGVSLLLLAVDLIILAALALYVIVVDSKKFVQSIVCRVNFINYCFRFARRQNCGTGDFGFLKRLPKRSPGCISETGETAFNNEQPNAVPEPAVWPGGWALGAESRKT